MVQDHQGKEIQLIKMSSMVVLEGPFVRPLIIGKIFKFQNSCKIFNSLNPKLLVRPFE